MAPSEDTIPEPREQTRNDSVAPTTQLSASVPTTTTDSAQRQQFTNASHGPEGQSSHMASATALLARPPSLFYRSMIEAADRVASGPVLDLAGSMRDEAHHNTQPLPQDQDTTPDISNRPNRTNHPTAHSRQASDRLALWDEDEDEESGDQLGLGPRDYRERIEASLQRSRNEPPTRVERITGNPEDAIHNRHFNLPGIGVEEDVGQYNSEAAIQGTLRLEAHYREQGLPLGPREPGSSFRNTLEHLARGYRISRRTLRSTHTQVAQPFLPGADASPSSDRLSRSDGRTTATDLESRMERAPTSTAESRGEIVARFASQLTADAIALREQSSSRPVPTAAALRAARHSWNLGANRTLSGTDNQSQTNQPGTTDSNTTPRNQVDATSPRLLNMLEQLGAHRTFRTNSDILHGRPTPIPATQRSREREAIATPASTKAINHLCYLTKLKHVANNGSDALALSRYLGLDSIRDSLINERVCDLPLLIEELPIPKLSSWLEPAMGWCGEQTGGVRNRPDTRNLDTRAFTSGVLFANAGGQNGASRMLSMRARRHRERLQEQLHELTWSGLSRAQEEQIYDDVERHLNEFVGNRHDNSHDDEWNSSVSQGGSHPSITSSTMTVEEKWTVKVTLHSVNWERMSLTGTMTAINIPDRSRLRSDTTTDEKEGNAESSSMESLFDGEIIDFRIHELETVKGKEGYTVGGPGIDVRYWAGVGPFRVAVEREKRSRFAKQRYDEAPSSEGRPSNEGSAHGSPKGPDRYSLQHMSLDSGRPTVQILTKDEEDEIIDETMAKCLGSQKWIQDNLKHWILMRWKERCFVAAPGLQPSSNPPGTPNAPTSTSESFVQHHDATWGLTISGFYYIALHRQTGKIEGLYYDPTSQPYQYLRMYPKDNDRSGGNAKKPGSTGMRMEFPIFEFR